MVLQVSDNIIRELTISGPPTEEEINNAERDQCPHSMNSCQVWNVVTSLRPSTCVHGPQRGLRIERESRDRNPDR
jgi:hypothetical protein